MENVENLKGGYKVVKKKDVNVVLRQYYKEKGLLPSVDDYNLLRDAFRSGKTHACLKQGGITHGKEKN